MKLPFAALVATGSFALVAAGQAGEKNDGRKAEAKGTLTLGEKSYNLSLALAYEETRFKGKQTIVILSEKRDKAKFTMPYKTIGGDEGSFPLDAYVDLRFDGTGALSFASIYADGVSHIVGLGKAAKGKDDDGITGAATIEGGAAKGKAGMAKPAKFSVTERQTESYQFDVAFDVAVIPERRKADRVLVGDPDRVQTALERKALQHLNSKGAIFRWSDPKTQAFMVRPVEPHWSVILTDRLSDDDVQQLQHIKGVTEVSVRKGVTDQGVQHLKHIKGLKRVGLGPNVTDQGLAVLFELERLEEVSLSSAFVSDQGIDKLADLQSLKVLHLSDMRITGQGFARFGRLPNLEHLTVRSTPITDVAMKGLKDCGRLKVLALSGTKVTDAGFKLFKDMKSLELLSVIGEAIGDDGVKPLGALPRLSNLSLSETRVTDAGMAGLSGAPALNRLSLRGTAVGNDGVKHLSRNKDLADLFLDNTKIDDRALEHIPAFASLALLDVCNTKISDEGLKHLRNSKITNLYLGDPKNFTDKGLEYLQDVKTLKYVGFERGLVVQDSNFTPEGVRRLQAALPDLRGLSPATK
jgi:hypothetical protein